jgi:hypothetical protein
LVILGCVKFFCPEKLCFAIFPSSFQHINVKKCLELGWDVLQERKNSLVWMLIPESVENKAFFGYEGISITWNPAC